MSELEENLMAWLRNAHAMEEQAETMLTALARRTGDYPEVKALIEKHLAETQRQVNRFTNALSVAAAILPP